MILDCEKIVYADNFFKRFKGLMFKKDCDYMLVFSNLMDTSIHTFFMRFDIDVYFLDENKIIVDKTTLKPWRFYKTKVESIYIVETKKNKLKLKVNDKLDFI